VDKLVAGPRVYICDACIGDAESAGRGGKSRAFSRSPRASIRRRCAFCGRMAAKDRVMLAASAGSICAACLETCRQIADSAAVESDPPAR
jgi:ATP-dependent protease Clp ATPase subunit